MKNHIFRVMLCASVVVTFSAFSAAQDPCDPYRPGNTNVNPNCGIYSQLPGQPDIPAATGTKLSTGDALQFAYNVAKEAQGNPTGAVADVAIAAISVGYPPAGIALGILKSLFLSDSGPDPVGEALQNMNKRIDDLQNRITSLQNTIAGVQDDLFNFKNTTRTTWLAGHINSVKEVSVALHDHLTTNEFDSRNTQIGNTAYEFLRNRELWRWNDLEVKTDSSGVTPHGLPDDFKALPAFEHYANALVVWMASLQYMSAGNPTYITGNKQLVAQLLKHAAFLSVEPTWRIDMPNDPSKNPDRTLPEQVMRRVTCTWSVTTANPDKTGMCRYSLACSDFQRHLTTPLPEYRLPSKDAKGYCADLIPDQKAKAPTPDQLRDIALRARFGSESLALWRDVGGAARSTGIPPLDAQLEKIENSYGLDTMPLLADKLVRLATTGTTAEPWSPRFDLTFYSQDLLYGVKPNGELLLYKHEVAVDKNPQTPRPASKAAIPAGAAAKISGTQPEPATPANRRLATTAASAQFKAAGQQPQYPVRHKMDGPKLVGTGWQNFREVIPAGGGSFYALTSDGSLLWYRHDGLSDGTPKWTGPIKVASGWNVFKKIFAGGDGVIYGIGADGSLQWYHHAAFKDATQQTLSPSRSAPIGKPLGKSIGAAKTFEGPQRVGNGWGNFVHVFSCSGGVIYGVTPDGRLMWYRHVGYKTGTQQWQGPKQVGSGWANMKRMFSPTDGVIYAMPNTGELLWYKHDGFADGTPKWEGPTKIAVDWSVFADVFPLMPAAIDPGAIH